MNEKVLPRRLVEFVPEDPRRAVRKALTYFGVTAIAIACAPLSTPLPDEKEFYPILDIGATPTTELMSPSPTVLPLRPTNTPTLRNTVVPAAAEKTLTPTRTRAPVKTPTRAETRVNGLPRFKVGEVVPVKLAGGKSYWFEFYNEGKTTILLKHAGPMDLKVYSMDQLRNLDAGGFESPKGRGAPCTPAEKNALNCDSKWGPAGDRNSVGWWRADLYSQSDTTIVMYFTGGAVPPCNGKIILETLHGLPVRWIICEGQ